MFKVNRWLSEDVHMPHADPEAEEFWHIWCKGEKGTQPDRKQAKALVGSPVRSDGARVGPDGQPAYCIPGVPAKFGFGHQDSWAKVEMTTGADTPRQRRRAAHLIRHIRFYLPDLPPASKVMYDELTPQQQTQVFELRRYHVSVGLFNASLNQTRWWITILILLPFVLVFGVYAAGLERVPLTGRWRIILLTPEEEDTISTSLAGANWYRSVINLLTTAERPAPPILPYDDWRWRWVEGVLRRLETAALIECGEQAQENASAAGIPTARYPLKPRPRVSSLLHSCLPGSEPNSGTEHLEIGPPYSLMIMEKDERNAFSYGFGGKGAGGIVVYTGLLDSILKEDQSDMTTINEQPNQRSPGLLSRLFGGTSPRPAFVAPTEAQTLHLACVLSHEMGHLLLSHHLETLSQQQVLWPSVLGLSMDLLRAFIWPFTLVASLDHIESQLIPRFLLGPTVNDALANVGRTSADELSDRYGQIGFQWKHEYEADLAGLR